MNHILFSIIILLIVFLIFLISIKNENFNNCCQTHYTYVPGVKSRTYQIRTDFDPTKHLVVSDKNFWNRYKKYDEC